AAKRAKEDANESIAAMKIVSEKVKELDERIRNKDAALRDQLLRIHNLPHESVPRGRDETENRLERTWGEPTKLGFDPKDHVDIGERLGILDFASAAKMSGARFTVLRGAGAQLERALI